MWCTETKGLLSEVVNVVYRNRGILGEVINVVYRNRGILSEVINVVYRNRGDIGGGYKCGVSKQRDSG